jgi:hypothetical protein
MQRVLSVIVGLGLAGYALYLIVALSINGKMLTLVLLLSPLLAALALGLLLVIWNVKKRVAPEPEAEEDSEIRREIP